MNVHPFPTILTRSSTHDALEKLFMDCLNSTEKKKLEAPLKVGEQKKDLEKNQEPGCLLKGETALPFAIQLY